MDYKHVANPATSGVQLMQAMLCNIQLCTAVGSS